MTPFFLTHIKWDDEGMGLEVCGLPSHVLAMISGEFDYDRVSRRLSAVFGFNHGGFEAKQLVNYQLERVVDPQDGFAAKMLLPRETAVMFLEEPERPPVDVIRLSIFAHHVTQLVTAKKGDQFTLGPGGNVRVKVLVRGPASDPQFRLNGVWEGNCHGAVQAYTKLVNESLAVIERS